MNRQIMVLHQVILQTRIQRITVAQAVIAQVLTAQIAQITVQAIMQIVIQTMLLHRHQQLIQTLTLLQMQTALRR